MLQKLLQKHLCFTLSTSTKIRLDSMMRPRSSSRVHNKVPQLQLQLQKHDTKKMVLEGNKELYSRKWFLLAHLCACNQLLPAKQQVREAGMTVRSKTDELYNRCNLVEIYCGQRRRCENMSLTFDTDLNLEKYFSI